MQNMGILRMKKIALIEDRYSRQNHFLDQNSIDLNDYENVLENFVEEKASNLLEQISNNSFDLSDFEIIVCHKSVENNTVILGNLKNYCQNHHKTLVLFSGGISVNYYDNTEFEILELNSKTFYSQNLVLFLEALKTGNEDVLMLCYGEHWKQNIVANVLEKINLFIFDLQSGIENPANFIIDNDLKKIDYDFYDIKAKTLNEIIFFRDSLEQYFELGVLKSSQNISTLIHYDNVCDLQLFINPIKFKQTNDDIDVYISQNIIQELSILEFDTLFIKDNLSSNYLELYGLRVAHHIRLSSELRDKRFVPIVIISDFDEAALCRFTHEANLLFTEGIYLCKNTKEDIQKYQSLELKGVSNYNELLANIEVSPPKDTSGSHDIANRWSIDRWADALEVYTDAIKINKEAIENKLYFKFLKALKTQKNSKNNASNFNKLTEEGKVLLIDDEWNKGWKDIISKVLESKNVKFEGLKYEYKDKEFDIASYIRIGISIKQFDPDVVILDLRLAESDQKHDDIDSYTGIKILEKIHEINAGIQVIMLTATSKSTTLEKLYEKKILGYIKKEHPEDTSIDTVENINKLIKLVDKGLERKYLKQIYITQHDILALNILNNVKLSFEMDITHKKLLELKNIVSTLFDTLNSNIPRPFVYSMLTLYKCIEIINDYYIYEEYREVIKDGKKRKEAKAFWRDSSKMIESDGHASVNNKFKNILTKLGINDKQTIKRVDEISCSRNYEIHAGDIKDNCRDYIVLKPNQEHILNWLAMIQNIIDKIRPN